MTAYKQYVFLNLFLLYFFIAIYPPYTASTPQSPHPCCPYPGVLFLDPATP